jgi:hypothetical protein
MGIEFSKLKSKDQKNKKSHSLYGSNFITRQYESNEYILLISRRHPSGAIQFVSKDKHQTQTTQMKFVATCKPRVYLRIRKKYGYMNYPFYQHASAKATSVCSETISQS